MPEMLEEEEMFFRLADDEAHELFKAYDYGPESWRIDQNGIRWVYVTENMWVSELGGWEKW
tara:strand:- start:1194 stop:1376 length:183 start_codon:yes stop_codon:yes gene_type:complete